MDLFLLHVSFHYCQVMADIWSYHVVTVQCIDCNVKQHEYIYQAQHVWYPEYDRSFKMGMKIHVQPDVIIRWSNMKHNCIQYYGDEGNM